MRIKPNICEFNKNELIKYSKFCELVEYTGDNETNDIIQVETEIFGPIIRPDISVYDIKSEWLTNISVLKINREQFESILNQTLHLKESLNNWENEIIGRNNSTSTAVLNWFGDIGQKIEDFFKSVGNS